MAQYRQQVLVAFQDVENALADLRTLAAQSEQQNLEVEATPSPTAAPTPDPVRTYVGYCVQLYYNRQLQDVQADPVRLLQQFPAPLTLPAE